MIKVKSQWIMLVVMVMAVVLTGGMAYGKAKDAGMSNKRKAAEPDAGFCLAPLNGALHLAAGTLEVCFSLDYSFDDSLRPEQSGCSPFSFLQVYDSQGVEYFSKQIRSVPALAACVQQAGGVHSFVFSNMSYYNSPEGSDQKFFNITAMADKAKGPWVLAGEWHKFTVTWTVERDALLAEIYIDGKLQNRKKFTNMESYMSSFSSGDYLCMGGETLSAATISSYRLSNRVRTKEEITADKPLVADESTTFFLNGETAGKIKKIKKNEFDAMRKNKKVTLHQVTFIGNVNVVNTPKGKAVQFYDKRSRWQRFPGNLLFNISLISRNNLPLPVRFCWASLLRNRNALWGL